MVLRISSEAGSSNNFEEAKAILHQKMYKSLGEDVGNYLNKYYDYFLKKVKHSDQSNHTQDYSNKAIYATIQNGYGYDLDSSKIYKNSWRNDFTWQLMYGKEDINCFDPKNRAMFKKVNQDYNSLTLRDAKSQKLEKLIIFSMDYSKDFEYLNAGDVLVFKTSQGRYGKMKILNFEKKGNIYRYGIVIKYELFE
jgi:hypothetical protein